MSGLSFGERTCLFGRSNADLNFVIGDNFFVIFRFPLKLNCCIAVTSRLELGK